jgi:hypothetical protein
LSLRVELKDDVAELAESILFMARMARLNDRPAANKTRRANGVQRETEKIASAAIVLRKLINSAHGDTLAALKAHNSDRHPYALDLQLREFVKAALKAIGTPSAQEAKLGRPTSRAAQMVADIVLDDFENFTGTRGAIVTRHDKRGSPAEGPYLSLLSAVFDASGIQASVERHGRDAIKRRTAGTEPAGRGGMVSIRRVKDESGSAGAH